MDQNNDQIRLRIDIIIRENRSRFGHWFSVAVVFGKTTRSTLAPVDLWTNVGFDDRKISIASKMTDCGRFNYFPTPSREIFLIIRSVLISIWKLFFLSSFSLLSFDACFQSFRITFISSFLLFRAGITEFDLVTSKTDSLPRELALDDGRSTSVISVIDLISTVVKETSQHTRIRPQSTIIAVCSCQSARKHFKYVAGNFLWIVDWLVVNSDGHVLCQVHIIEFRNEPIVAHTTFSLTCDIGQSNKIFTKSNSDDAHKFCSRRLLLTHASRSQTLSTFTLGLFPRWTVAVVVTFIGEQCLDVAWPQGELAKSIIHFRWSIKERHNFSK